MKAEVGKVNKAIKRIRTHNITELNSLLYAAAYVTTEIMGMLKERKGKRTKEPFWKRRIETNLQKICGWKIYSRTRTFGVEVHRSNIRVKRWHNKYENSELY